MEGFTADDLDRIPDLPPHAELIDGSLVLVSPQKRFHMRALRLFENALARLAPRDRFLVSREMSEVLNAKQRPEPDVIVRRSNRTLCGNFGQPADQLRGAVRMSSA